jgi:hypothetical protein
VRRQFWVAEKQRLDTLYDRFDQLPDDLELRSHWTKYLCVLTSGFLETSLLAIYAEYARAKASPRFANFVERQLTGSTNYTMEKVERLVASFDQGWSDELTGHADYDRLKASVNSVVNNRNRIAHGQSTSLSFGQLTDYYSDVVALLDLLFAQCDR